MDTRKKSKKVPGSVFNFSIYLSVIVTENPREIITNKYMEKLKTPPGNFCKRLVPKIWSV